MIIPLEDKLLEGCLIEEISRTFHNIQLITPHELLALPQYTIICICNIFRIAVVSDEVIGEIETFFKIEIF